MMYRHASHMESMGSTAGAVAEAAAAAPPRRAPAASPALTLLAVLLLLVLTWPSGGHLLHRGASLMPQRLSAQQGTSSGGSSTAEPQPTAKRRCGAAGGSWWTVLMMSLYDSCWNRWRCGALQVGDVHQAMCVVGSHQQGYAAMAALGCRCTRVATHSYRVLVGIGAGFPELDAAACACMRVCTTDEAQSQLVLVQSTQPLQHNQAHLHNV
jgi:hypothetical protein